MARPFGKKRQIKISRVIQLIFAVSFFTLTSCGIPTPFYMPNVSSSSSSTYYQETIYPLINTFDLQYTIAYSPDDSGSGYNFQTDESVPSLVFLYSVVPESLSKDDISKISKRFIDTFSSNYINNNNGKPLETNVNDIFENKLDTYLLQKFHLDDGDNSINNQVPPNYGLTFDSSSVSIYGTKTATISFAPKLSDGTNFNIVLTQDSNTFEDTNSNSNTGILMKTDSNSNFPKTNEFNAFYKIDTNQQYKVLIFTALNVTSESYTNIFWSKLMYLGYISSSNSANSGI